MEGQIPPSTRGDRMLTLAVFGVGAVIVAYGFGATMMPTQGCVDSTADCESRPGLGILWALGAALVVVAIGWGWERLRPARATGRVGPWYARFFGYLVWLVVIAIVAFAAGGARYEASYCGSGDECDLGALEGLVWAFGAVLLSGFAIAAYEMQLIRRRYRGRVAAAALSH